MATYSRTLRLNDGIISVQRANLSQYSIVSAYIYTSKGASPKTLHSQDRLQKPDGTLLNANAEQILTAYFGGIINIAFSVCILYFLSRQNVVLALKNKHQ